LRTDKNPDDVDTLDDVREIYERQNLSPQQRTDAT